MLIAILSPIPGASSKEKTSNELQRRPRRKKAPDTGEICGAALTSHNLSDEDQASWKVGVGRNLVCGRYRC